MGDLGPAVGSLPEIVSPVLGAAFRALLRTVFGIVLLVLTCIAGSVWLGAQGSVLRGVIAGLLCLVAGVVVTGIVALKNAMLRGVLAAVEKVSLGQRAVRLVFTYIGVRDETTQGERAGAVGRLAERVPLRDAEVRLRGAVQGLLKERADKLGG